jgi:hypothetical protein
MHKTLLASPTLCKNKANSIWFAHQSLCSPRISTLLKTIRHGFLKGCPNLTTEGVTKYLNPSPAMAKGHIKQPRMGIRSTQCVVAHAPIKANAAPEPIKANLLPTDIEVLLHDSSISNVICPPNANLIEDEDTSLDANMFCFAAFVDKRTGTLYNDLTGPFPFMSLEGNVCFLIVYHYKINAILALPIKGFCDAIIFEAYKQQFNLLQSKGYKIKLNVMDNQAAQIIKKNSHCARMRLTLSEPHNHQVNAAKRAIQTFKAHFISALATTDSKFLLQL